MDVRTREEIIADLHPYVTAEGASPKLNALIAELIERSFIDEQTALFYEEGLQAIEERIRLVVHEEIGRINDAIGEQLNARFRR